MSSVPTSWLLSEPYAGLQSQGFGLTDAAGWSPELRVIAPRPPWSWIAARSWPLPLRAVPSRLLRQPWPDVVVSCGGTGAALGAAMRGGRTRIVQVQNPRLDPAKFDVIVANRHDELTGPNVIVTRTALHRVTEARLAEAAEVWRERLAHLPRPLVAVLVGGSNGRFRLDRPVGEALAAQLAAMMRQDGVGLVLTPSRRTDPAVTAALTDALTPLGGWVWDGTGENPYFGLLALADAFVVTMDSVSMVSEAAATAAPVMIAELPGRSRRIGLFTQGLIGDGRIRPFAGRLDLWPVRPINDTQAAADEMRHRLGL